MSINKDGNNYKNRFQFGKRNFVFVGIGLGLMLLGYLLMIGGKTKDPAVFNPEELYSFVRITLAPFLILAGLGVQIYAILLKPDSIENDESLAEVKAETKKQPVVKKEAPVKVVKGSTGQKCKLSGVYFCGKHKENTIPLSKGERFPPCSIGGGHKATWELREEV